MLEKYEKSQIESEIIWLSDKITKLSYMLDENPSKIKQINEYKKQIKQKQLF
jgi:hypothetical protein